MKRQRGSVRFDPYYKVQWFDAQAMAWRDIQQSHQTIESATAAFLPGRVCRVMRITPHGRTPL